MQAFKNVIQIVHVDIWQLNATASVAVEKNRGGFSKANYVSYKRDITLFSSDWYMFNRLPMKSWCALLECRNIGSLVSSANWNCFSKYLNETHKKHTKEKRNSYTDLRTFLSRIIHANQQSSITCFPKLHFKFVVYIFQPMKSGWRTF